jgi:hypothetical protein
MGFRIFGWNPGSKSEVPGQLQNEGSEIVFNNLSFQRDFGWNPGSKSEAAGLGNVRMRVAK